MENIKQSLIELIADFLDTEEVKLHEALAGVIDPQAREETDLHIRMAEAAFKIYKSTMTHENLLGNAHI